MQSAVRSERGGERGNRLVVWLYRWCFISRRIRSVSRSSTHSLCLKQTNVVLLRPNQVVLVDGVVLRYRAYAVLVRLLKANWKVEKDLHPVPINHTGPADSERIPRPLNAEICLDPPLSRSWSASHTHVPYTKRIVEGLLSWRTGKRLTSRYAVDCAVRWRARYAAEQASLTVPAAQLDASKLVPSANGEVY